MRVTPSPLLVPVAPPQRGPSESSTSTVQLPPGSPESFRGSHYSTAVSSVSAVSNQIRMSLESSKNGERGSPTDGDTKSFARRLSQTLQEQDSDHRKSESGGDHRRSESAEHRRSESEFKSFVSTAGMRRAATQRATTISKNLPKRRQEPTCRSCSRAVIENKLFVAFTTFLTVYALVGDDFKLCVTNKPADVYFDAITIICLLVFTAEILFSCAGKSDYFLGFFFVLDVIATSTMILDISWVAEFVMGDSENLNNLRSGRTARVGARAGRVVRVIRLVRILKLYKAIYEAREAQRLANSEDDWGDDEQDDEKRQKAKQTMQMARDSKVGKKLSEVTTRRVIGLVLSMLLVRPFLQVDSFELPPIGSYFGAEEVLESFSDYKDTPNDSILQLRYEKALLKFMYFFNWFSGNYPGTYAYNTNDEGPFDFRTHVFWVGIMTLDPEYKNKITDDTEWDKVRLRYSTVQEFANNVSTTDLYDYGSMPAVAKDILAKPWAVSCEVSNKDIWRRGISLLEQEIDGEVGYAVKCPEDLRPLEKTKYYPRTTTLEQYKNWHFAFYFDTRPIQRAEAIYSLMTTGFVCVILCVASLSFSDLANRLVLRPLEKMMNRVDVIRNDPLVAVQMADEEFKHEEKEKAKLRKKGSKRLNKTISTYIMKIRECCKAKEEEEGAVMETVILEKTIIKLGSLLALGFGEAGANIIHHNMAASESAGVNGMIPGERVEAIIGVARIRDFSVATEVLKAKVMTFVNQIAEIVHGIVSEFHGAANKNNGETFMLIWRISGLEENLASRYADFSTIAFAKILGAVHRSPLLASYRGHPALQQRLGSNYRVNLSIGLHSGWAIEGAVGSEFKIDASYLSPNVSIALSVEQATNIYHVPFLVTCSVMDLCCQDISSKFRRIDRVRIKGSTDAIDISCLDLECMNLHIDHQKEGRPKVWNSRLRFKARQFLEAEKRSKLCPTLATVTLFDNCQDIVKMRKRFSMDFMHNFDMGFANYFEGEWQAARRYFMRAQNMIRVEDGPSVALLRFMENHHFQAPTWWQGVHELVLDASHKGH